MREDSHQTVCRIERGQIKRTEGDAANRLGAVNKAGLLALLEVSFSSDKKYELFLATSRLQMAASSCPHHPPAEDAPEALVCHPSLALVFFKFMLAQAGIVCHIENTIYFRCFLLVDGCPPVSSVAGHQRKSSERQTYSARPTG